MLFFRQLRYRGTTSLTGNEFPAAHYCCDGLTRPVLLGTVGCGLAVPFFRKLTGDGRVKAASISLAAAKPHAPLEGSSLGRTVFAGAAA